MLGSCIESLLHAAKNFSSGVEIIVVDNHSRDNTVKVLSPRYPQIKWLALEVNTGFGAGCNRGAALAKGEYLLFINPDTVVDPKIFQVILEEYSKHPQLGILGCRINNPDGSLQLACRRSFPTPKSALYKFVGLSHFFPSHREFGRYNLTYLDERETQEVDAVSGSFMFVQRKIFEKVGGFDTTFFMYGEDLDLCKRIQGLGFRNIYTPNTSITHFKSQSAKSRPFRSLYHFYHAMIIYAQKHFKLQATSLVLFSLGALVLGTINFIHHSWAKWPRWGLDLFLSNLILFVSTLTYVSVTNSTHFLWTISTLYLSWHALLSTLLLLFFGFAGDYGRRSLPISKSIPVAGFAILTFFTLGYFFYEESFSRIALGFTGILTFLALIGWRHLLSQASFYWVRVLGVRKKVILVGDDSRSFKLKTKMTSGELPNYDFLGYLVLRPPELVEEKILTDALGNLDRISDLIRQLEVDEVIVSSQENPYDLALGILRRIYPNKTSVKILVGDLESRSIQTVDLNYTH